MSSSRLQKTCVLQYLGVEKGRGVIPELLGCFGTLGSRRGCGAPVSPCGEVINMSYELLGHWKLLVWLFLLVVSILMR